MNISFGSINTGLPKDIVKQVIAAEKIPLQKMQGRKEKINAKKALVGELTTLMQAVKSKLLQNGNARSLKELKVNSNDEIVSVNVDKNVANTGNYQLEVLKLAQKSSAMTSGFEDPEESHVGVGFIQYNLPNGDEKEVYIDSDNASLKGIAKVINKTPENGLRATVVNDGSGSETPWRLLISLENTGDENLAKFPYFYFVDGVEDLYIEQERPAQDAVVKIDGFEIEVGENQLKDVIPGAVVDLKKAVPGTEFTISITEDKEAVAGKITELVDTINGVLSFIKQQNNIDQSTDTSRTLGGDSLLQTIESRIRAAVFQDVETSEGFRRLSDIGISFNREGLLDTDSKKFEAALSKGYQNVSEILAGRFLENGQKTDGVIDNFTKIVNLALKFPNGILSIRDKGFKTKIKQIDNRIEQKQRMIDQREQNLKDKFARLEGTISRIQSQGAGVAALGAPPVNAVTQLG